MLRDDVVTFWHSKEYLNITHGKICHILSLRPLKMYLFYVKTILMDDIKLDSTQLSQGPFEKGEEEKIVLKESGGFDDIDNQESWKSEKSKKFLLEKMRRVLINYKL